MTKKLRNLVIDRVDLVDAGANFDPESGEGAFILLAKHAPDDTADSDYMTDEIHQVLGETDDEWLKRKTHHKQLKRTYGRYAGAASFVECAHYDCGCAGTPIANSFAKVTKSASPEDQLDQLVAAFAEELSIKVEYAYGEVLKSAKGRALYAEIRALKREQRPRSLTFAERLGRTHEEPTDVDRMVTTGARIRERENMMPTREERLEADALLRVKATTGSRH